tara:strand:+ start:315 stop:1520 length:1206 start_codon:yes stop_codon:yes gene_type:complete
VADRLVAINTAQPQGEQLPVEVRTELAEVAGDLTATVEAAVLPAATAAANTVTPGIAAAYIEALAPQVVPDAAQPETHDRIQLGDALGPPYLRNVDAVSAVTTEIAAQLPTAIGDAVPTAVSAAVSDAVPTAVDAELSTAVPAAINAAVAAGTLPPTSLSGIAAAALSARMTVRPTIARRTLMEALIYDLMVGGVWEKLDGLYVLASHDEQAAKLNWLGAGMQDLTSVNAPVFQADRGFTGDGATNYLDTNSLASGLALYKNNDATMGVYARTTVADSAQMDIGVTGAWINVNTAPGNIAIRAHQSTSALSVSNGGDPTGLFVWSRDATNVYIYKDGALLSTQAANTSTLPGANMTILKGDVNYSTRQISAAFFGRRLTNGEHSALNTALAAYLTGLGAAV